ncbi:MAG: SRPBCC family protein [Leptolyngbyaceae cyanobacterium bins.349]|nr:SRPBCC family protein [Leptolyngbyaceae cyanobacterium bins.349]
MAALLTPVRNDSSPVSTLSQPHQTALLNGEILLETRAHTAWGAGVTAQMYLPCLRDGVWQQLIDYPRWQQYFPDVTQSQVLQAPRVLTPETVEKRLHQAASKSFLFLTAQVEVYLRVLETQQQRIQFYLESGHFVDFSADLHLHNCLNGTLLTYSVQATPIIPIPSVFIQQAIHLDLPSNMRNMRRVICDLLR